MLVQELLQFQTQIRLYHWHTKSYPRHVASGDLYTKLDPLIDAMVESMQQFGRLSYKPFALKGFAMTDATAVDSLKSFAQFLETLELPSTDLQNIRDEMLTNVHRTLYLFSFH